MRLDQNEFFKNLIVDQSDFSLRVGDLLLVIFSDVGAFFARIGSV